MKLLTCLLFCFLAVTVNANPASNNNGNETKETEVQRMEKRVSKMMKSLFSGYKLVKQEAAKQVSSNKK